MTRRNVQAENGQGGRGTQMILALIAAASTILVGYWQFGHKEKQRDEVDRQKHFTGRVTDVSNGRRLQGAKVSLDTEGVPPVLYTDSEGIFSFNLAKDERSIHLIIEAQGYKLYDRRIDSGSASEIQDIRLSPTPEPGKPLSGELPPPAATSQSGPESMNLIANSSFEQMSLSGSPKKWELRKWQSTGTGSIDKSTAYSGSNSVKVSSELPAHVSWSQSVKVEKQTTYVLTAMLRASEVVHKENPSYVLGAGIGILGLGERGEQIIKYTEPVLSTIDWRPIEVRFDSGSYDRILIMLELGGYYATASGTAWFDDVSLQAE